MICVAYSSWRKEVYKTFLFFHFFFFQNIFVDGDECRIKSGCADFGLKALAVDRHHDSIRILVLKILSYGIDVVTDNPGCTGSIDKGKLWIVSLNRLLNRITKLLLSAKHNALLIYICDNEPWVLNYFDASVNLTDAVHINRHDGTAHASLR